MYTLEQYNSLIEAIALGAMTVKYSDKEVTYRSLTDMNRLKLAMESQLGINPNINRRKYVEFNRGYDK